jgi:hypothetical protein
MTTQLDMIKLELTSHTLAGVQTELEKSRCPSQSGQLPKYLDSQSLWRLALEPEDRWHRKLGRTEQGPQDVQMRYNL